MEQLLPSHTPMRLLVIEDDAGVSTYIAKTLREHGHTVDTAADGLRGLAMAAGEPYDVWVIDRMLPKLDGLQVLRQLREGGNHTPALILSALGEVDDRVEGLKIRWRRLPGQTFRFC